MPSACSAAAGAGAAFLAAVALTGAAGDFLAGVATFFAGSLVVVFFVAAMPYRPPRV